MPVVHFQVKLSVRPGSGGEAKLVLPDMLQDKPYQFVILKAGGEEAIVRVEAPDAVLKEIGKDPGIRKLTSQQAAGLQKSYPRPALKRKYRMQTPDPKAASGDLPMTYEVDANGQPIIDTYQTVRSGFYLIDVPVLTTAVSHP
jgi:hypothetical protein